MHFLQDYARNGRRARGFPTLNGVAKLENPDMREYLMVHEASEASARASRALFRSAGGVTRAAAAAPTLGGGERSSNPETCS